MRQILLTLRGSGSRSTVELLKGPINHLKPVDLAKPLPEGLSKMHIWGFEGHTVGEYLHCIGDADVLATLRNPYLTAITGRTRSPRVNRPLDWVIADLKLFTELMPALEQRGIVDYRIIPDGGESAGRPIPQGVVEQVNPLRWFWDERMGAG